MVIHRDRFKIVFIATVIKPAYPERASRRGASATSPATWCGAARGSGTDRSSLRLSFLLSLQTLLSLFPHGEVGGSIAHVPQAATEGEKLPSVAHAHAPTVIPRPHRQ